MISAPLVTWTPPFGTIRSGVRQLRRKLLDEGWPVDGPDAYLVGITPHFKQLLFVSTVQWDVGYVFLSGSDFGYVGERTRFRLTRDAMETIESVHDSRDKIPQTDVRVGYRSGDGEPHWLFFCPMFQTPREFGRPWSLARRMENWAGRDGGAAALVNIDGIGQPESMDVSDGRDPEEVLRPENALSGAGTNGLLALALAYAFTPLGFEWSLGAEGAGWLFGMTMVAVRPMLDHGLFGQTPEVFKTPPALEQETG